MWMLGYFWGVEAAFRKVPGVKMAERYWVPTSGPNFSSQRINPMTEKATFAAGCFWGVEAAFRKVPGVVNASVGYTGGTVSDPTYEMVCSGGTGHAEAIEVEYDPDQVSYETLLDVFWNKHDPTQMNRQGPDVGTQYRSAIFTHTPEQQQIAEQSKAKLDQSGQLGRPVATEITPATQYYPAEEYHQQYIEKRSRIPGAR